MATPIATAVTAVTSDRDPSSTQDAVKPGFVRKRIPTAAGATSARTPRRRITRKATVRAWPVGPTGRTAVRAGSTAEC